MIIGGIPVGHQTQPLQDQPRAVRPPKHSQPKQQKVSKKTPIQNLAKAKKQVIVGQGLQSKLNHQQSQMKQARDPLSLKYKNLPKEAYNGSLYVVKSSDIGC